MGLFLMVIIFVCGVVSGMYFCSQVEKDIDKRIK